MSQQLLKVLAQRFELAAEFSEGLARNYCRHNHPCEHGRIKGKAEAYRLAAAEVKQMIKAGGEA